MELFAHPEREIWREFEIRSDIGLDKLHRILQVVMGWTDSHLHRFSVGADWYSPEALHFMSPFDVQEGHDGLLEDIVRVDQVLQDPGDTLHYLYDFGDDWRHLVTLLDVSPLDRPRDLPRCLAGRNACPPENSGGAPGYVELMEIVDAAVHDGQLDDWGRQRLGWLLRGVDLPELPQAMDTFDVDEVNAALRAYA